jgi:hypothetical protein
MTSRTMVEDQSKMPEGHGSLVGSGRQIAMSCIWCIPLVFVTQCACNTRNDQKKSIDAITIRPSIETQASKLFIDHQAGPAANTNVKSLYIIRIPVPGEDLKSIKVPSGIRLVSVTKATFMDALAINGEGTFLKIKFTLKTYENKELRIKLPGHSTAKFQIKQLEAGGLEVIENPDDMLQLHRWITMHGRQTTPKRLRFTFIDNGPEAITGNVLKFPKGSQYCEMRFDVYGKCIGTVLGR